MGTISIAEAKTIAERAAMSDVKRFMKDDLSPLMDYFATGGNCWFFFRRRDILIPIQLGLLPASCYAVSIWGDLRYIADFYDDKEKLEEYLKTMSNFFVREHAKKKGSS